MQDDQPIPLLYLEGMAVHRIQLINEKFSLQSKKGKRGYLFQSRVRHSNFKTSFLDLFFAALKSYEISSEIKGYLFERNPLRENVESSILGPVSPEILVQSKIDQWRKHEKVFTLSGLAQATLQQTGIIATVETIEQHLSFTQLNEILIFILGEQSNKTA